ncbi:MAG TPA: hypothetical protein VI431_15815 [Candidatus Acidoferrum sp.]
MKLLLVLLAHPLAALILPAKWFWPHFAGIIVLFVGLVAMASRGLPQARGMERAVAFGPLFFAVPMAVFGGDHFISSKAIAAMVPAWIPGHLFWVYLVGTALFAAALSIVTGKHSVLAASLLSAMLFSFVLLIHVPNFVASPGDRVAFAIVLRDSSFSAGALACALAQAPPQAWLKSTNWITILVRYVIAVPVTVFGVEQFLHPKLVPVVPLRQAMPLWIPAQLFIVYMTGAVLIASGLSLLVNWKPRLAATALGIYIFVIVLLVYLPIMAAKVSDIANGLNYFADTLAFSGTALLLADVLPGVERAEVAQANREESPVRVGY